VAGRGAAGETECSAVDETGTAPRARRAWAEPCFWSRTFCAVNSAK